MWQTTRRFGIILKGSGGSKKEIGFVVTDDAGHSGRLRLTIRLNGAKQNVYGTTDVVSSRLWYHVAAVRTSGRLKLYVNGVEEADTADDKAGTLIAFSGVGGGPTIGDEPGSTEQVDGLLDEMRFYNRVLTPQEVADLFNGA